MRTLLSAINYAINILFPETCSGCKKIGAFLCDECIHRAARAEPLQNASASFITALFDYHNRAIRFAIWRFKYKNARSASKYFSKIIYEAIIHKIKSDIHLSKSIQNGDTFLLIPIPLHPKRLRERGYNQSELLAQDIIKYDTEKFLKLAPAALTRIRSTKPQAKKEKRAERFENLRNAFAAVPEHVRSKHIILIDDVTTTGATFSEARKTLLRAGAKTVNAFAIAH